MLAMLPAMSRGHRRPRVIISAAVSPLFADGFETGDTAHTENGAAWLSGSYAVSAAQPHAGTYALLERYAACNPGSGSTTAETERDISLGGHYPSIWIEAYLWIPSNYFHPKVFGTRTRTGGAVSSGSAVLTTVAGWDSFDRNVEYTIPGAGAAGADLVAYVASVDSSTQVTLDRTASTTVTGQTVTHTGRSENNKFFGAWGRAYGEDNRAKVIIEWTTSGLVAGDSQWRFLVNNDGNPTSDDLTNYTAVNCAIDPSAAGSGASVFTRGAYNRLRLHFDVGSNSDNGIYKVWVNDTLILNVTDAPIYPNWPGSSYAQATYFDTVRFLGAGNAGFRAQTDLMYDDVKVYTSDPGWV